MRFWTSILIILLTLASPFKGKCQCLILNFIKNPSLEDYSCCPTTMAMISCAEYWQQPLIPQYCTSDYFNICGIDSIQWLQIKPFFLHSYFGSGYAGIINYDISGGVDYREYIQGELSEPLIKDKCYYAEFWTLLSGFASTTAIDALGICFSDTLPKGGSLARPLILPSQINNETGNIISDTNNWSKISGFFYATGGEKFLTVGTFKPDNLITKYIFKPDPTFNDSYYFFDNFSLCPCEDTIPPKQPDPVIYVPNIFSPNNDGQNDKLFVRGQQIESLHFLIYNRWGNLVFESKDINEGWDGIQNGKKCETGVYVYRVEVTFKNGETVVKRGDVTVVR